MSQLIQTKISSYKNYVNQKIKEGRSNIHPLLRATPNFVEDVESDLKNLNEAIRTTDVFKNYVVELTLGHQDLDFGYFKLYNRDLENLVYSMTSMNETHLHPDLYMNLEYVMNPNKDLDLLCGENDSWDQYVLSRQLKEMRAIWVGLQAGNVDPILDTVNPDCQIALYYMTRVLYDAKVCSRRVRRTAYALCRILNHVPEHLIPYINKDLIENFELCVPFRRKLVWYLLKRCLLFSDLPLEIRWKDVCYDERMYEEKIEEVQEQVFNVASQSRSDIETLVLSWNEVCESMSVERMVAVCECAREQGLFNVSLGINDDTKGYIDSVVSRIGNGVCSLYTDTMLGLEVAASDILVNLKYIVGFLVAAVLVGVATYCGVKMISKLFNFFLSLVFKSDESMMNVAQEQSSGDTWNGPLMLLMSVFGVSAGALKSARCMNAIRCISMLPRAESGIDTIFTWIKSTYTMCYRIFSKYVLGVDPGVQVSADSHPVASWLEELGEPYKSFSNGTFSYDSATFSIIHSLFIRGLNLQRSESFRSDQIAIRTGMDCLNKILTEFRSRNIEAGSVRNPPVVIYLHGGSGVGKSTLTNVLAASILSKIQPDMNLKKQWKNLIYSRASEQEFWDGYTGQLVTVFDDFSQRADSAGNPNVELFDIVRAANVYPYPLHMANLSDKASTNFTSKIIICSSNLKQPKTESLNFPNALYRRFDVCVSVSKNEKYSDVVPTHFVEDFYQFQEYDMLKKEDLGSTDWEGIVDKCVELYKHRSDFVSSLDEKIQEILQSTQFEDVPLNVAQEQVNCDVLGFCNCDCWGETMCVMTNLHQPKWKQWLLKMKHYVTGIPKGSVYEAFEKMRFLSQEYLNASKSRFGRWLTSIKERFPVIKDLRLIHLVVATVVMGPMVFFGVKKLFAKKNECVELHVSESYDVGNIKPTRTESYETPNVKPTKTESYESPNVKSVKTESYESPNVKPVRVEMSFPSGRVSGSEMNLASLQLDNYIKEVKEQGVSDQNAAEICSKLVTKNMFKIYVENDHVSIPLGHVLFIKGRIAIMPHHFLAALKKFKEQHEGGVVYFRNLFLSRAFFVKLEDMIRKVKPFESPEPTESLAESRDLCSFCLDNTINFSDVSKLFVSKSDLSYLKSSDILLPTLSTPSNGQAFAKIKIGRAASGIQRQDCRVYGSDPTDRLRLVRYCWRYVLETEVGDCGAPLIARNVALAGRKIMGIHIAGNTDAGFSTPLYKEDIDTILSMYPLESQVANEQCQPIHMPTGCHLPESTSFVVLDKIEKPLYASSKSVISPSPLHGILTTPKTKPCQLRDTPEFSPMQYRLEKFASPCVPVDARMLENSVSAVSNYLCKSILENKDLITTSDKSRYSFEEAVSGIDEEEFINSVKRSSSPGYPFVFDKEWNSKERIFGKGPEFDVTNEKAILLRQQVEEIISQAKLGVRQQHVFIDTLKDERKPIHKAHKTRMFSACPLDYLIACKMYFGGVVSLLQKSRNICGISVGTNVYSYDWTIIANTLLSKSPCMIAGDFEGFDSSQLQDILRAASQVLLNVSRDMLGSTEEDLLVMQVLLESLLSSVHLNNNYVYMWLKGLPSGHFLTAIINSIFVLISFNSVWQIAFGVNVKKAFEFFEVCGIVAYGDDHIVSVPEWATNVFNQYELASLFKQIGLSYTLEDKDATVNAPYRSLNEVSYLKRKFLWDEDKRQYLAPLSLETILETPMWVKKCVDVNLQTTTELENSLKELCLHPQSVWDSHIESFKHCAKLLGSFPLFLDREFARSFVLNENV
uniref:Replicase n=1 Tax=Himetobi P virus TaxID=81583 RepID=V9XTB9_9VIRU|nr:replicase [Himetobi P virus]